MRTQRGPRRLLQPARNHNAAPLLGVIGAGLGFREGLDQVGRCARCGRSVDWVRHLVAMLLRQCWRDLVVLTYNFEVAASFSPNAQRLCVPLNYGLALLPDVNGSRRRAV